MQIWSMDPWILYGSTDSPCIHNSIDGSWMHIGCKDPPLTLVGSTNQWMVQVSTEDAKIYLRSTYKQGVHLDLRDPRTIYLSEVDQLICLESINQSTVTRSIWKTLIQIESICEQMINLDYRDPCRIHESSVDPLIQHGSTNPIMVHQSI